MALAGRVNEPLLPVNSKFPSVGASYHKTGLVSLDFTFKVVVPSHITTCAEVGIEGAVTVLVIVFTLLEGSWSAAKFMLISKV